MVSPTNWHFVEQLPNSKHVRAASLLPPTVSGSVLCTGRGKETGDYKIKNNYFQHCIHKIIKI
jgi:hypothetical protein